MFESPSNKKEEKPSSDSETHSRIMKGIEGTLLTSGTIFALAGIYEFMTGNKFPDVLSSIDPSMVPDILKQLSQNLLDMPMMMKTTGGSSMIFTSQFIGEYIRSKLGKTDQ